MKKIFKTIIFPLIILIILSVSGFCEDYNIGVIVQNSKLVAYKEPAEGFINSLNIKKNFKCFEYHLDKQSVGEIKSSLKENKINLIYAIGDKPTKEFLDIASNIPMIFSTVLNYYNIKMDGKKIVGITQIIPFEIILFRVQGLLSNVKKVGVIYSDWSSKIVDNIREKQKELEFELIEVKISSKEDIEEGFKKIQKADAIYQIPDPTLYDFKTTMKVIELCKENKIPFIGFSDKFVEAGAAMSMSSSYSTIGSQAAVICENLLVDKQSPESIGIVSPIGSLFVVNATTLKNIGIILTDELSSQIDELKK